MMIRIAQSDDVAILAQMNHDLIRDEGHRCQLDTIELQKRMLEWIRTDYQAWLFELDGSPVGYALFRQTDEHIYLRQFFIVDEHRRKGLGRDAIQWLRDNCWRQQRIRLDVLVHNQSAKSFWHSIGFRDYCIVMELENEHPT